MARVLAELEAATAAVRELAARAGEGWRWRPGEGRWSAGECVVHLNLTSREFLPLLRDGVERARELGPSRRRRYRRGLLGWLLCATLEPPPRFKTRTSAPFVPLDPGEPEAVAAELAALQGEIATLAAAADGLAIDRVKVVSPFDRRVRYDLYSAFRVIPVHQRRHLWQAERALEGAN